MPEPQSSVSAPMRPPVRSTLGQMAKSRSLTGERSIWPPSPGTGTHMPRAGISAPAPSPVPGPRTTRAPSAVIVPPPIGSMSASVNPGRASDCASKSLSSTISLRPKRATVFFGSTTHGQLVSGTRSPEIGPASASMADCGRAPPLSITTASMASSIEEKSAVCTLGKRWTSPVSSGTSEKRALVPPISPISTGKGRWSRCRPTVASAWLMRPPDCVSASSGSGRRCRRCAG